MQQAEAGAYENALRGISVQDMTADIARKLNLPARVKGVIVNDVDENSPAAGVLAQGDVIQEINRKKVGSVKEYQEITAGIKKDENILLLVFRGGSSVYITLSVK
jgi:serine protease Do